MSSLPNGYIGVEYIESSGTQYINTGFKATGSPVKYHVLYRHDVGLNRESLFGSRETAPQRDSGWAYGTSGGGISFYIGESIVTIGSQKVGEVNDLTIEITSDTEFSYSLNGVAGKGMYNGNKSNGIPQYLFALNVSDSARFQSTVKMYAFSIIERGNLVRDFVPCINPNSEIGMYDTVTTTFFGNAGPGVFVAGPIRKDGLITDRTAENVARVKLLAAKAWQDMTRDERTEWLTAQKGAYNYTDLNRVETAVAHVAGRLKEHSYLSTLPTTKVWSDDEIPTASDLSRYFANVASLRRAVAVWASTPQSPTGIDEFGASEANDLEQILIDVDLVLSRMSQAWFYLGDLYSAEV